MQHVKDLVELVSGKLSETAQSDLVVGQPIEAGEVTIVPLSAVSLGFGGGGGEGEGEPPHEHGPAKLKKKCVKGKGLGGGTGGGAKVRPVAVAVFTKDRVEIIPIGEKKGLLDKLFDRIPELIEMAGGSGSE